MIGLGRSGQRVARMPVSEFFRVVLSIAVAVVAGLSGFGVLTGKAWAAAWLAGYAVVGALSRLRTGDAARAFRNALERVNGSTAGLLDTITSYQRRRAALTEDQSHALCVGLLARLRETAAIALTVSETSRMRVTLAAPHTSAARTGRRTRPVQPDAVRVWCYDQPYSDRQWTSVPLTAPG